jgi:hypothetical protein
MSSIIALKQRLLEKLKPLRGCERIRFHECDLFRQHINDLYSEYCLTDFDLRKIFTDLSDKTIVEMINIIMNIDNEKALTLLLNGFYEEKMKLNVDNKLQEIIDTNKNILLSLKNDTKEKIQFILENTREQTKQLEEIMGVIGIIFEQTQPR